MMIFQCRLVLLGGLKMILQWQISDTTVHSWTKVQIFKEAV